MPAQPFYPNRPGVSMASSKVAGPLGANMGGMSMPPPNAEIRWYYRGPDGEVYGPYTAREMVAWSKSGYFTEHLLIRTEHEANFHSLGDWTAVSGQLPFLLPVPTFDILLQATRGPPQQPPYLCYPPGLQPPAFPPAPPARFAASGPPYLQPPPNSGAPMGGGGGMQPMGQTHQMMHHPLSQPPSEPHDGSSVSHTPDSDNDYGRMNASLPSMMPSRCVATSMMDAPWLMTRDAVVDARDHSRDSQRCVQTQTLPIVIGSKDASRILSELLNTTVHIT